MKELNLSLLLRYGYAGFLLVGILLFINPSAIKTITDNAGTVLSPLLVLAAGACIYVVYRYVVGEWILFPLSHCIDGIVSRGHSPVRSPILYLLRLGVKLTDLRPAYNALRHEVLEEKTRNQLDFAHAEIHVLYITCIELMGLAIYLTVIGAKTHVYLILIIGIVILCGAISTDIQQHRSELRTIQSAVSVEEIERNLRARGFLPTI
jgi:hypothetical protein